MNFDDICKYFCKTLKVETIPNLETYSKSFIPLYEFAEGETLPENKFDGILVTVISEKLDLYNKQIKNIIDKCAELKVYFNYHEKNIIRDSITSSGEGLRELIYSKIELSKIAKDLLNYPKLSKKDVFNAFISLKGNDEDYLSVTESVFSRFLFDLFPLSITYQYNSKSKDYIPSFYQYLRKKFPEKYSRTNTLTVLKINSELYNSFDTYESFRAAIFLFINNAYIKLQNHCFLAILIEPIFNGSESATWMMYSDIVLYAEKFIEEELKTGYFHPDVIQEKTSAYIKNINTAEAKFDLANTGFSYRDCIVISDSEIKKNQKEVFSDYKILVLFQKNERDEDTIPCPSCRSFNVRGNSYPILGVKSWECNNPLCPDKSKYNRGKRYSLSSIIKQEAIDNPENEIDNDCLSEWRLDVVSPKNETQILEYLIKQYTFCKDTIHLFNFDNVQIGKLGRRIEKSAFPKIEHTSSNNFFDSAFFKRFVINSKKKAQATYKDISKIENVQIYNGDCELVLKQFRTGSFDGAVTSPPYYNAKEYSQWDNIYCYLYDMFNHAREVFRTLKPGGYFIYNIFDYFDNEMNIVFSAMGKKRMILGAYIINLFRRIGFEIQQNTIWYKGYVQGHRSDNQGNKSPYYQSPINCYEHIFCFRKPGKKERISFPQILNASPVIKIIKGKNVLGHTAPYPEDIPELLIKRIPKGYFLDPYSGSFTSARVARNNNCKAVGIEFSKEYCLLGMKLLKQLPDLVLPLF